MEYSRTPATHLTTKNGLQLAFDFIIINMKKNCKNCKYRENRLLGDFSQFQLRKFGKICNWISNLSPAWQKKMQKSQVSWKIAHPVISCNSRKFCKWEREERKIAMNAQIRQPGSFCYFSCACENVLQLCANLDISVHCRRFYCIKISITRKQPVDYEACVCTVVWRGWSFFFSVKYKFVGFVEVSHRRSA